MLSYALQASIVLVFLYLIYWVWLRKITFYGINRIFLLLLFVLSLGLPAVTRLIALHPAKLSPLIENIGGKADRLLNFTPADLKAQKVAPGQNPSGVGSKGYHFMVAQWLEIVYCAMTGYFLCRLIIQLATILRIIYKGNKKHYGYYSIVNIEKDGPPLSFFRWIIFNPGLYADRQLEHILMHEKVHVRQYHTIDILFMELFACFFWFHPFAWRSKNLAKLNLEFIADRESLKTGIVRKDYQYSLLNVVFTGLNIKTANYFNYSHLKKRIAMMNVKPSGTKALWKYLLFPVTAISMVIILAPLNGRGMGLAFAGDNMKKVAERMSGNMDIYLVIRGGMNDGQIDVIKKELAKEGIDVSISDISYNSRHLLAGFRIVLKQKDQTLGELTVSDSTKPLSEEPVVFYLLRSGQNKSGLTRGYPQDLSGKDMGRLRSLTGLLMVKPGGTDEFELHGSAVLGK